MGSWSTAATSVKALGADSSPGQLDTDAAKPPYFSGLTEVFGVAAVRFSADSAA